MPPFPGEETLATVYTDLHSYFTTPSPRPALHRFDKASYFYVYHNSTRQTSRIEVAINAGTPEQTAFSGFLDSARVINSHRFPTRLTLVVDGDDAASPSSARSPRDSDEWRLPSSDPRDPGTSKYRIHTVDLYFWNHDDSKLVVDIFKRLLHPHQLDLEEIEEDPQHEEMMSPVVQNLENVAISDPAYKGRQHDSASERGQLPPPPPTAASRLSPYTQASTSPASVAAVAGGRSSVSQASASNFTPLTYNPAAPAAPEPIAHREDTPPPPDAGDGTGLSAAAKHDHYAPQQPPQMYGGPPSAAAGAYGHYGSPPPPSFGPGAAMSPPPSFGPQAAATVPPSFGPHASSTTLQASPGTSVSTSFAAPPPSATSDSSRHPSVAAQSYVPHPQDPNSHIFGQPSAETPGTQFYQSINAPGQPHKALQHVQPQYPDYLSAGSAAAPVGGYSAYNYNQNQPAQPAAGGYDIHSQVYRPTEDEHHTHHHSKPSKSSGSQRKPSTTEKVEKGFAKWMKKAEQKLG